LRDGKLLINSVPTILKGVNRHEFDCRNGIGVVSRSDMVQDIMLMKQFNFNAVRCSHYPNQRLCMSTSTTRSVLPILGVSVLDVGC
jgi:beta-galactosidase